MPTRDTLRLAVVLIAVALGALPLLIGSPAASEDWPSHVARVDILTQLMHGDMFWAPFYQVNSFLLPNIAADISVVGLHALGLPVAEAARIVLGLAYLLFVGGAWALSRALGTDDLIKPLLAVVLFYNGPLMDGFINYMIGAGLTLWCLAAWLAARGGLARLATAMLGAVAVFFCHVIAAGFFLSVIGLLELSSLLRVRDWRPAKLVRYVSPLVAAIPVLVLYWHSPVSGGQASFSYTGGPGLPGILRAKILLFVHPVLDGCGLAGAAILALFGLVLAGLLAWALWSGRASLRTVPGFAFVVGGLVALFLAVPNQVGDGLGLDYRLPPLALLMAILLVRVDWRDLRLQALCLAVLLTMSGARSISLVRDAAHSQAIYRGFTAASAAIPPQSALLSGVGTPRPDIPWSAFWQPAAEYMGTLATRYRVFVPSVFALRSQHPLILNPSFGAWSQIFDVSDPARVAAIRTQAEMMCNIWNTLGHAGSVYMVVVYPSRFSDGAFPVAARRASGTGFRLVDLCVKD